MVMRAFREWLGFRRLRGSPCIDDLDPRQLSIDWQWTAIVHLNVAPGMSTTTDVFDFVGQGFAGEAASCRAGTPVSAVPPSTRLACAIAPLERMIATGVPVIAQGALAQPHDAVLLFRSIALPYSDRAGTIRYALAAFSGGTFARSRPAPASGAALECRLERFDDASGAWVEA